METGNAWLVSLDYELLNDNVLTQTLSSLLAEPLTPGFHSGRLTFLRYSLIPPTVRLRISHTICEILRRRHMNTFALSQQPVEPGIRHYPSI